MYNKSRYHIIFRYAYSPKHNSFPQNRCSLFKECGNNTYGVECKQSCGNCSNGEPCHHVNGSCPSGCDAGAYGVKCKQPCGNCSNGDPCNDVDGSCLFGCCLLYTSPSPRDLSTSRMPSSA